MSWTVIDTILISAGGNWWIFLLQAFLIVGVIWVLLHKTYLHHERNELTDNDVRARIQERLANFNPEDLVPSKAIEERILKPKVLQGKAEKRIVLDEQTCLNLSTMNFLDLIGNRKIEDRAVEAIEKYGVGSCGPRGFYGTVEAHLDLEERLAKFMGTEDAIVYSYGFSCIASAIPAYAKRHDIVFADERVNFAIQKGLFASRSTVKYFKHNNHNDLEVLLMEQELEDKQNPVKAAKSRRFVIIEGIYMNTGELVDLPYYLTLKERYKFRLFIDESISFGTLANGHGITGYYKISIKEIDMVIGSLEYAVGSIGGFCCGSKFIIEHQRLSGLGYCFSASQPPLHAVAALKAIDIMEDVPQIFTQLTTACKSVSASLRKLRGMIVHGWDESPIKHLYLCPSYIGDAPQDETLQQISDFCLRHGLAVTCPSFIADEEKYPPVPSLRICVNRSLKQAEIEEVAHILQTALDEIELSLQIKDDDNESNHQTRDDDHQARLQRRREACRRVLQEREARQQPQEETNRTNQQGRGEVSQQQQEGVSQQVMLHTDQQEQHLPGVIGFLNTHQSLLTSPQMREQGEEHLLHQPVRQSHHQIGAHVEQLDNREREAREEQRRNIPAFRRIEARQAESAEAREARESRLTEQEELMQLQAFLASEIEAHQRGQGDTEQMDEEDNFTCQIRRRTHHE